MIAVLLAVAIAVMLASIGRSLIVGGRVPEALALGGLALGVAAPWPFSIVPVAVGVGLALRARGRANGAPAARVEAGPPEPAPTPSRSSRPRPPGVRARFMAAMGHELRSPLNSIMGFAQLLEDGGDGPLNDAQRENVVLVRRAAGELLTLLTDILDTARFEAGRVRLDREWTAPVEVLTLALERFRAASNGETPTIDAQLQPGLAPLYVDRARLGQAIVNVLRAVVRGRARVTARVREAREGDRPVIRFEILESEKSIGDADAGRAFDPDPAARPQGRSLALGLALSVSRDLAQLHGGDARAELLDGGTNWIVWVPVESNEPPPTQAKRRPRASPGGPSTSGTGT